MHNVSHQSVLILDFGSQYTQLIARRVRESKVYCEIHRFDMPLEEIKKTNPGAIVLSGGPKYVTEHTAPPVDTALFDLGTPILAICYGMQLVTYLLGGEVGKAGHREYGHAKIECETDSPLFAGLSGSEDVWMSHGDRIERVPDGFEIIAKTGNAPIAGIGNNEKRIYGIQFHPEVAHTPRGIDLLENFLFGIAGLTGDWTMRSFIDEQIESIRKRVGDAHVICGLSGGVDSSVTAKLVHEAIGDRLTCIFVDNGLLREGESAGVMEGYAKHFNMDVRLVDASKLFLDRLAGITDPQEKRKVIGPTFVDVFLEQSKEIDNVKFLAQGTLYPDVIESVSFKGPSAVIKTHHNLELGDLLNLDLIEPLRELFKDEVRLLGEELGIAHSLLWRHPFPGPGLAIRIIGDITEERLAILRKADAIVTEEFKKSGWYEKVWQAFAILLPVKSVGVMGDERTYENVAAIRAVSSKDAMTADWAQLPPDLLSAISRRIVGEVRGINRVVYDITSKPPGTIEWE